MVATVCLLFFMLIATITDARLGKIFNWTTYTGIVIAVILALIATLGDQPELSIGIEASMLGFLVCGAIMVVCLIFFQVGGGDVKLLAMVGAFLGPQLGIEVLLWTFVIGAAIAVIVLIWKNGVYNLARRVIQQMMLKLSIGSWDPLTEEEEAQMKSTLYLAPSALLATVIVQFSLVNVMAEWLNG